MNGRPQKARMLALASTLAMTLAASGCVTGADACRIFRDDLRSVEATTRDGERRLAGHFETGVSAGCWRR